MKIEAVIFDMDGTLVDTEALHHHCWNIVIRHFGKEEDQISEEEYAYYAGKDGLPIAAMMIKARPHIKASPKELKEKKKQLLIDNIKGNVKLIDHADQVLARCKELGLRIAVATGADRVATETKVLETEIGKYFDHMVTASEVENKKPHPETYVDAYTGLGVDPKYCVAVEDTESGVNSAKSAGLYCIAKPSASVNGQDLSNADIVVETLLEAMDHIEKLMKESA